METFFADMVATPLLELLAIVVLVETIALVVLVIALGVQTRVQERRRSLEDEFEATQLEPFFEALMLPRDDALDAWHAELDGYPDAIVRGFLADNILRTSGDFRDRLVSLYRRWGYVEGDHRQLLSGGGRQRLIALRRLYAVASPADRDILMDTADGDHFTRILLAQILSRIGEPQDLITLLGDLELDNGLMQEPIHSALDQLDEEGFAGVFERRDQIKSVRVRRILLTMAARRGVEGVESAVLEASRDFDPEVRIGACDAAVYLRPEFAADILRHRVDDTGWEVRARAAKLLHRFPSLETFEVLVRATRDPSFWVRQNATGSLRQMGPSGLLRLEGIAVASNDGFAVDSAVHQLQQAELEAQARQRGTLPEVSS